MVVKRPHASDDSHMISSKHIRRIENFDHLVTDICCPVLYEPRQNLNISVGECEGGFIRISDDERSLYDLFDEVIGQTGEFVESGPSRCISLPFHDAETVLEPPFNFTLFPEYFASEDQLSALHYTKEAFPSQFSPQKLVPIGPDHQTEIPEWGLSTDLDPTADEERSNRLIGACVTPMPESEGTVTNFCEAERISCKCIDRGSMRCVQFHVRQSRENLKKSLGQEVFRELGFYDMGEEVAKKWTGEERQAFNDAVSSSPLSLGKNFWDELRQVLPSRRMEDFVSYYYNVYMLQKRAEQNRFDPQNIDSDDDEWETAESTKTEEDDSVVDSPTEQDTPASHPVNHVEQECHEGVDEFETDTCKDFSPIFHGNSTDVEDEGDIEGVLEQQFQNASDSCCNTHHFQLFSKFQTSVVDCFQSFDAQDDSCTSFESQGTPAK